MMGYTAHSPNPSSSNLANLLISQTTEQDQDKDTTMINSSHITSGMRDYFEEKDDGHPMPDLPTPPPKRDSKWIVKWTLKIAPEKRPPAENVTSEQPPMQYPVSVIAPHPGTLLEPLLKPSC